MNECPTCGKATTYCGVCHECAGKFAGPEGLYPPKLVRKVKGDEGVNYKTCGDCAFIGTGAVSLTGARECQRGMGWVNPADQACEGLYAPSASLSGALCRLEQATGHLRQAFGLLTGTNVGTVFDPRHPSPPSQRKRKRG